MPAESMLLHKASLCVRGQLDACPANFQAVAGGCARAWRWLAQEVAWLGVLYCKWLTNHALRPVQEKQLLCAWNRVWQRQGVWGELGFWGHYIWIMLDGIWNWKGVSMELLKGMLDLQRWLKEVADNLEKHLRYEREELLKQRLAEGYPGSDGLLRKMCKWRRWWR